MTVLPFKKRQNPPNQPPGPGEPIAYVTLYDNATHFHDPNRDEPDPRAMADALFDATFQVHRKLDDCLMLVMIGADRSDSLRGSEDTFKTKAQRAWLRRRLDTLYHQVAHQPRNAVQDFFDRLLARLTGDT